MVQYLKKKAQMLQTVRRGGGLKINLIVFKKLGDHLNSIHPPPYFISGKGENASIFVFLHEKISLN